jgi:excisionase family DNA binding protein
MTTTPTAGGTGDPTLSGAELLDVRAVAQLLNCSTRHIFRMRDGGKMPRPMKLGALVRWSRADVLAWIAAGCPAVRRLPTGGGL